ncbi:MAG TPA: aldehyde dehydrogenase family protein [Solirubrobacteraceae bacterium]|jgi:aldehyde dehydrogenase (NAD+)|nr:aldehyde dehydrogenase family protein [Solirubrobacteraceae bacterium]
MITLIRENKLFLDGRWIPGAGDECEVEDPATEVVTGVATTASLAQVDEAVAAARAAFEPWAATPVPARVAFLRRLHTVISERAERLAGLITREQGSPPSVARRLHVDTPLAVIEQTANALEQFEFVSEINNSRILREPVGVVAAITPWNLPLHQIIVKVVPVIAAGATVVLKPAALTPLTAFELARAFADAGAPAGIFNLVPGAGHDVGDRLTRHPDVDQVSFTGSTAVGRQIAIAAAETIKRVTLELGGKSASVVLSDVDDDLLVKAVKVTVGNCYLNAGQTCTALSRLIVPAGRIGQVEGLAAAAAARYTPGDRLGPLISASQRKEVRSFFEPASVGSAVRVYSGDDGSLPDRGYYVPPAVYSRVEPGSRIAQEEVFGPVLAILAADDDEAAVALANDSIYGLGGAVWGRDQAGALAVAARIRTGQVDINGGAFNARAPFGGYKQSGIGREIGDFGIADVLQVKAVQR